MLSNASNIIKIGSENVNFRETFRNFLQIMFAIFGFIAFHWFPIEFHWFPIEFHWFALILRGFYQRWIENHNDMCTFWWHCSQQPIFSNHNSSAKLCTYNADAKLWFIIVGIESAIQNDNYREVHTDQKSKTYPFHGHKSLCTESPLISIGFHWNFKSWIQKSQTWFGENF